MKTIKQKKRICKKRLVASATEKSIQKAVEYLLIGFLIGVSVKMLFLIVASVMASSVFSKIIKLKFFESN